MSRHRHKNKIIQKQNINEKINIPINKDLNWHRDLSWCPSQLWKEVEYNKKNYRLYARWRHINPWSGYIISLNKDGDIWSSDILNEYNFSDETDITIIENKLLELFDSFIVNPTMNIKWSFK